MSGMGGIRMSWVLGGISAAIIGYQIYSPNSYWNSKHAGEKLKRGVSNEVTKVMPRTAAKVDEIKQEVKSEMEKHMPKSSDTK
ncbi:unnamed protein product [Blepharisma stoltei]|uniref:Uncharacterized protein n=1 Tax=Blepharisma stoltei TaxID=1481888 RepID=A0AAU9IPK0_9CILI|nr:unnamed protein product [Blepharisma stoltei]